MSTLGKTTAPTGATHGWIQATNTQNQVGMLFTMPAGGGTFTSVSFWAAGDSGTHDTIYGCIWDSSGSLLARGSGVDTSNGQASAPGGPNSFYTDTLQSALFVSGGTQIFIGWHAVNGSTRDWAYNASDHSPDARARTSSSSTPNTFAGNAAQSPAGAVAAYGTYQPGTARAYDSAAFQAATAVWAWDGSTWRGCAVWAYDGSAWQLAI
jgi:hypothetical protein